MASDLVINPKTIYTTLQRFQGEMERALPRHMTPERMARIALTQLRVNPKLFKCTEESFLGSLMAASQLGLEPGINGQCYLIPYGTTCTLVPGWKGYMDLLSRTGRASAWTGAVYDGDEFDYEYGDKPFIHHKPGKWSKKEPAMIFVYAVGRQKEAEWPVLEVWDIGKVNAHRDQNNKCLNKGDHYSFKHPEMYARKIPLLQVLKYLPSSVELSNAGALDITAAEGKQKLTIDMALKGDLDTGAEISDSEQGWPEDKEVDDLFAKLSLPKAQYEMIRENYQDRDALLKHLRNKLSPQTQTDRPENTTAEPAQETNAKKGGRPKKDTPAPETKEAEPATVVTEKVEEKPEPKPDPKHESAKEEPSSGMFAF